MLFGSEVNPLELLSKIRFLMLQKIEQEDRGHVKQKPFGHRADAVW